jgi:hypothetical protein
VVDENRDGFFLFQMFTISRIPCRNHDGFALFEGILTRGLAGVSGVFPGYKKRGIGGIHISDTY